MAVWGSTLTVWFFWVKVRRADLRDFDTATIVALPIRSSDKCLWNYHYVGYKVEPHRPLKNSLIVLEMRIMFNYRNLLFGVFSFVLAVWKSTLGSCTGQARPLPLKSITCPECILWMVDYMSKLFLLMRHRVYMHGHSCSRIFTFTVKPIILFFFLSFPTQFQREVGQEMPGYACKLSTKWKECERGMSL